MTPQGEIKLISLLNDQTWKFGTHKLDKHLDIYIDHDMSLELNDYLRSFLNREAAESTSNLWPNNE